MPLQIRRTVIAAATAFGLLLAPVAVDLPGLSDISVQAANGKGKGSGNSSSKGSDSSSSKHGGSQSQASQSRSSSAGAASHSGAGKPKPKDETLFVETAAAAGGNGKPAVNAELAGLNSLKRNINGLMNSADPRMEGVREYILANAALAETQNALAVASQQLATAETAYADLLQGLGLAPDTTLASLAAEIAAIDALLVDQPEDPDLLAQKALLEAALIEISGSSELANLLAAQQAVLDLEATIAALETQTDDAALLEALTLAANQNRLTDDYFTGEVWDWSSAAVEELVDAYLAQQ